MLIDISGKKETEWKLGRLSKKFSKDSKNILNKANGENILFVGSIGSGKSENMLQLYNKLFLEKNIGSKSIYIDLTGNTYNYLRWISVLDKHLHNDVLLSNFTVLNFLTKESIAELNLINFKSCKINKVINNHTFCIAPLIYNCSNKTGALIGKKINDFLINLPDNKDEKEIPIFVSDLFLFNLLSHEHYNKTIEMLNRKGYFFVTTIEDFENNETEELISILLKTFNHIFLNKIYNYKNCVESMLLFDENDLKVKLNDLNIGEYYYFYNLMLKNKNVEIFYYEDIPQLKVIPSAQKIKETLLEMTIRDF